MVYWMAQASRSGLMQEAIFVFLKIISWSTRNEVAGGKKDLPEVASILPVEAGNVPTLLCDILTASRWRLFIEVVWDCNDERITLRVHISPEDRRHCSQLGQLWYSTWRRAEPGRWRRDLNLLWIKKNTFTFKVTVRRGDALGAVASGLEWNLKYKESVRGLH